MMICMVNYELKLAIFFLLVNKSSSYVAKANDDFSCTYCGPFYVDGACINFTAIIQLSSRIMPAKLIQLMSLIVYGLRTL